MNKTVENGQQYGHPLSNEGKVARYGISCSDTAAYVLDQLTVQGLVAATFGVIAGHIRSDTLIASLRDAMEFVGDLERQVADLREQLVHAAQARTGGATT